MNPQYKVLSHFRAIFLITTNATITTISETLKCLIGESIPRPILILSPENVSIRMEIHFMKLTGPEF